MMRSLSRLKQEQAARLDERRQERVDETAIVQLPRTSAPAAVTTFGRVAAIVPADPCHGPHLLVVRQIWVGVPPEPSDIPGGEQRCYPAPHRRVSDYAVGEYVRLAVCRGAVVAEPLAP